MPKVGHFAFKQNYPSLSLRLLTEAKVFDIIGGSSRKGIDVTALWDTGAMGSAITPSLAKRMNLIPFNRIKVNGINDSTMEIFATSAIGLPNLVMVEEVNVMICNMRQGFDLLLGMNIILLGDLSISNADGKTLFTFAIPPFKNKTDLYEKAIAVNRKTT